MAPTLSIILAQYNPAREAVRRTLASFVMQNSRDFEVIVSDDGSREDYFEETRAYLEAHGVGAVKLAKNETNRGTVYNLLGGVRAASGRWVLTISPGDYLYDENTLPWLLARLGKDEPKVAFGRLACYRTQDGVPVQAPGDPPFSRSLYDPMRYQSKAIKRALLLYDDGISGCGMVYERELFLDAMQCMAGRVILAEDFCIRMFAVQGIRITRYDRSIAWYEVGSGVSTDRTAASEARMLRDWKAMLDLLKERFPRDGAVRLAWEYYHNDRHRSRLVRGVIGRLIVPQNLPFKKQQKAWQPPVNGELAALQKIYDYEQGETT